MSDVFCMLVGPSWAMGRWDAVIANACSLEYESTASGPPAAPDKFEAYCRPVLEADALVSVGMTSHRPAALPTPPGGLSLAAPALNDDQRHRIFR